MTIIEELETIATACVTSEEFTKRAKYYLNKYKGISQPIMTDSEMRDIFRRVEAKRLKDEAWYKLDKVIKPALSRRPDCKGFWYEVWVDLDEDWEQMWFGGFRYLKDEEIVEACAKYLNDRERFYSSPDYYDMLNNLIKDI